MTLLACLLLLGLLTPAVAVEGNYSVTLRLSGLTSEAVRTTVRLGDYEKTTTVTGHATELTIDYRMNSDQVLDNSPILLDVSTQTAADFKTETVELSRDSPRVTTIAGLVRVVSTRSQCAKNYFGPFCSLFCAANEALHWACDSDGVLRCAEGWSGPKCSERACSVPCVHGHCAGNSCRCRAGFAGEACDICLPAPGCASGSCKNNTPGTCECKAGWAGPLCNIDLSLCSKRSPCAAGSTCIVKAPGKTECICPEGKTGANCDVDSTPSSPAKNRQCPCKNGGTCLSIRTVTPVCKCPAGFTGETCESPIPTVTNSSTDQNQQPVSHNLLIVLNALLCLVVLAVGVVLIIVAMRFIRSAGVCGPSSMTSSESSSSTTSSTSKMTSTERQTLSSVSLLMPDCTDSTPSSPARKVVIFDTVDDARPDPPPYTPHPTTNSTVPPVYSISVPPTTNKEKFYDSLHV